MLKLKYDVKCGWNQLYIVEKDVEFDISFLCNKEEMGLDEDEELWTEQDLYSKYKDWHTDKLVFELGLEDLLYSNDIEYYAHEFFETIYKKQNCFPGLYKIFNVDLILIENSSVISEETSLKYLRASEVMSILNISRNTLTNYTKRGLILIDNNYIGKQYRYNTDSVMYLASLLKDNPNKRFSKKEELIIKDYYKTNTNNIVGI